MTRISLPFPPSVHGLYRGGRWRGDISPEYKAWRDLAGVQMNQQFISRHEGKVRVLVRLVAPDKRDRDSDNYVKAVLDLLVAHGIIAGDDRKVLIGHYVEWADEGQPCTVIVQDADDDTWEAIGLAIDRIIAAIPVRVRGAA